MTIFDDLIPEPLPAGVKVLYGTVTGSSPLRVQVDRDPGPLPVTPTTTVACAVGDRVVMLSHVRADNPDARARAVVIVGVIGSPSGLVIGGVRYATSGAFELWTPTSWGWSNATAGTYAQTWSRPRPYEPPTGYGFVAHLTSTSAFGFLSTTNTAHSDPDVSGRYVQFGNASYYGVGIGWQLVKI